LGIAAKQLDYRTQCTKFNECSCWHSLQEYLSDSSLSLDVLGYQDIHVCSLLIPTMLQRDCSLYTRGAVTSLTW